MINLHACRQSDFDDEASFGTPRAGCSIRNAAHLTLALAVVIVFSASLNSCVRDRAPVRPVRVEISDLPDSPPRLRVCIAERTESCTISCSGPVVVLNDMTSLAQWPNLPETAMRTTASGLMIGDKLFDVRSLTMESTSKAPISVNGTRYRGTMSVVSLPDAKIHVINHVGMEEYLLGVVGCEMSGSWPSAALSAQAVAARSFALRQWMRRKRGPFDLRATQSDQVYRGFSRESRKVAAAVEATRGAFLFWRDRPLKAFYGSCCGGYTANVWQALTEKEIPPLKGGPCGFCDPRGHVAGTGTPASIYRWRVTMPTTELADGLRELEYIVDKIVSIRGIDPDASGRVPNVEIALKTGGPISLKVRDFRRLIGFSRAKSTKFTCKVAGDEIVINGYGWGHGVGMCQWGAKGMAGAGYGWAAILRHYYPAAEIRRLY